MTRLSALQMTSQPTVEENLALVKSLIKKAVAQGSQLVVLPEMFPIGGVETPTKIKISEAYEQGPIQDFLSQEARHHQIWIVGGTIPLTSDQPGKIRAACLVFNDQGNIVGRYDKIHLFDVVISDTESYQESSTTDPGNQITVVDTPFGKLGLAVCYDIRFPELFRQLFHQGAEIIAVPSAFTVQTGQAHWEILARSRAIENFCYLIGACQTGTHQNGRRTYGHSMIIHPWGNVIASLTDEQDVITADIHLEELRKIRRDIPVDKHRRL